MAPQQELWLFDIGQYLKAVMGSSSDIIQDQEVIDAIRISKSFYFVGKEILLQYFKS